jgi:hypothetical protein
LRYSVADLARLEAVGRAEILSAEKKINVQSHYSVRDFAMVGVRAA